MRQAAGSGADPGRTARLAWARLHLLLLLFLVPGLAPAAPTLRIGVSTWQVDTPSRLAARRDLFNQPPLAAGAARIETVEYGSGRDALHALLRGEVDFALCTPAPLAERIVESGGDSLDGPVALASILLSSGSHPIIAHRRLGIRSAADLAGHRLGLVLGTAAHAAWSRLAQFDGLGPDDVELVGLRAEALDAALLQGEVDAIAVWEPWATRAAQRLGSDAVRLDTRQVHIVDWLLVARRDWVRQHPDAVARVLRGYRAAIAILNGEPEAAAHGAKTVESGSAASGADAALLRLRLSWSTLVGIHAEIEWHLQQRGLPASQAPAPGDYLDPAPLRRIAPEAVFIPPYLSGFRLQDEHPP